jgi:hypothetical protein
MQNGSAPSGISKICSKERHPYGKTNGITNKKTEPCRFLLILELILMQYNWPDLCYVNVIRNQPEV